MTKKVVVILAVTILLCLCGCDMAAAENKDGSHNGPGFQLAQEETLPESGTPMGDQLIGCVVTMEYLDLFDFEGYLEDNLNDVLKGGELEGDTSQYQGRIYATRTGTEGDARSVAYTFEGIDGYACFMPTIEDADGTYITNCVDAGFGELHQAVKSADERNEKTLTATMYFADDREMYQFYMNPVYQDANENVYLVAGNGMSTNSLGSCSMTLDNEIVTTVDGEETAEYFKVEITYQGVPRPEKIVILQMGADSAVLHREEYAPGQVPEELRPVEGTDYIVVETYSAGGVSRELYGKDLTYLHTYVAVESFVCEKLTTEILWEE